MKKIIYLIALCMLWAFTLPVQGANVIPVPGTFYNITQIPSNMVFGAVSTQPVVQTANKALNQAFEFIPVEGMIDTYYIRNYFEKYLNKSSNYAWDVVYESAIKTTQSQWTIVDDASSTTLFRLMLIENSKYLATDLVTTNSAMYCDKAVDNERGLFSLTTATIPTELVAALNGLTLGDISAVNSNLTLPLVAGTTNIPVSWSSSLPLVIAIDGTVTQPDKYDITVKLTATMSEVVNGETFTFTKEFIVTVKAKTTSSEVLAQWNFASGSITESNGMFNVKDQSESGFVGTLKNEARIRTIGGDTSGKVNVLDLGNGTGYFDMGTEIGKAIYSLNNYSMCAFFRIDENYAELSNNGNFIWTFSNSDNVATDKNGYIIGSLKGQFQEVTSQNWQLGAQSVGASAPALKGGWHHMAFTQNGNIGTLYIDGVQVAQNTTLTNTPSLTLPQPGMTGTAFNWLGRSNYPTDVYLRNTLIYDFQLLQMSLSPDDMFGYISVADSIAKLDQAYLENPDFVLPELSAEQASLELGDLTALVSSISLPSKGTIDNSISISWNSSAQDIISKTGAVTRPNYFDKNVTLTATLSKNGQKLFKTFPTKVLVAPNTQFTNNLLVKYDFSTVSVDSIVTDAAEKHFTGIAKKNATIQSIGTTTKFNVLNLGDSIGYFDMGAEVGKVLSNLSDYTMSCYYRINDTYDNIAANGNFLWSFSNSTNANTDKNGYIIGSLKDLSQSITPGDYTAATGNQALSFATAPSLGEWHNLTYTQKDSTGTLYVDGLAVLSDTITNIPATALTKAGLSGTPFNWLGRSCYMSDTYLRKTLVYDFRLYKIALSDEQVQTEELNVGFTINALNNAYDESINGIRTIKDSPYKVIPTSGGIKIEGLSGTEKVSVFDITGRQLKVVNINRVTAITGVYIVNVNGFVAKVIVK